MTSRVLRKAAFVAALPLIALSLYAADPPRPGLPPAPGAAPPSANDAANLPRHLRAKQVLGAKISIQNNTAIGTIDDIVLSDAGEVEYLIVVTGENKLVSVPWSTAVWGTDYKSAVVNITAEQFKVVPVYTTTTYPDYFAPTYRTETYKYYGTTPGQLRRVEKRIIRP
jgi:PRC-barrel domain